ncbi:hypothetical protein [Oceanobacillus sp. CF4.6]
MNIKIKKLKNIAMFARINQVFFAKNANSIPIGAMRKDTNQNGAGI